MNLVDVRRIVYNRSEQQGFVSGNDCGPKTGDEHHKDEIPQ